MGLISEVVYELTIESWEISCCYDIYTYDPVRSQLCWCVKSWPDLVMIFHLRAIHICTRFVLWTWSICEMVPCLWIDIEIIKRRDAGNAFVSPSLPGQNGCHFGRQHFQMHFLQWKNDRILIKISLKFVTRNRIDNKPALVQVIAWCRIGNKPLSEPMLTRFTDAYMRH